MAKEAVLGGALYPVKRLATVGLVLVFLTELSAEEPPQVLPQPQEFVPPKPGTPEAAKLKADIQKLIEERRAGEKNLPTIKSSSAERDQLRKRILDLVTKLKERAESTPKHLTPDHGSKAVTTVPSTTTPHPPNSKFEMPAEGTFLDPLNAGKNLFRSGDVQAALTVFKAIDPKKLSSEDQLFLKYLMASSYRKLGFSDKALEYYREVANAPLENLLKESALWQINMINSTKQLRAQIDLLKSTKK